jgi:integrase
MHSDDVHLERPPRIHVHRQVYRSRLGPVKDSEARDVPVLVPLQPILREWLQRNGPGFLFRPLVPSRGGRRGKPASYVQEHTMWRHLRRALRACGLPEMTWYEATKHTFASHWLMNGNSIEKLASILGHSDAEVTRRYGHLRTDLFTSRELSALPGPSAPDANTRANGRRLGYVPASPQKQKSGKAVTVQ